MKAITLRLIAFVSIAILPAMFLAAAHAQTETVLYSFCPQAGCDDGATPNAGLTMDKNGNLYGTTVYGGANHYYGAVFEVSATGVETVLHSFNEVRTDGYDPGSGVVVDKKGNVYGTTYSGGAHGFGTVFEVSASGVETILYSFNPNGGKDGVDPYSTLVRDAKGNLYGTDVNNGANGHGTIFEVSPSGAETVLYSFGGQSGDGEYPSYGLAIDEDGNLYGTTSGGGANGSGAVFEFTAGGVETVLYSFNPGNGTDGYFPGALVVGKNGNLYGTTSEGGAYGAGTIFSVSVGGVETILHAFNPGNGIDGGSPNALLVLGKKGTIYGTTLGGGAHSAEGYPGTVFKLNPRGVETVLYSFGTQSGDGYWPNGLVRDKKGNLYGTTNAGGANGAGTVFRITP